jgi:cytochrome oxidase assembly protein ShyY1
MQTLTRKFPIQWTIPNRKCFYSIKNHLQTTTTAKKSSWLGPMVFSCISITAGCLSIWQMQRYYWKVNLIETLKKRVHESAISINSSEFVRLMTESTSNGDDEDALAGRRVILIGEFDHDHGK